MKTCLKKFINTLFSMSAGVAQETGRGNNEELSSPQNSPLPPPPPPPSPPQQQTIGEASRVFYASQQVMPTQSVMSSKLV